MLWNPRVRHPGDRAGQCVEQGSGLWCSRHVHISLDVPPLAEVELQKDYGYAMINTNFVDMQRRSKLKDWLKNWVKKCRIDSETAGVRYKYHVRTLWPFQSAGDAGAADEVRIS